MIRGRKGTMTGRPRDCLLAPLAIPWLTTSMIILSSCLLPATTHYHLRSTYPTCLSICRAPFSFFTVHTQLCKYHIPRPHDSPNGNHSVRAVFESQTPGYFPPPSVQCPLSGRAPMSPVKANAIPASDDKELPIWDRLVAEGILR